MEIRTSSTPTLKKHFWLYIITIVASLGGLLSGFDMGVISGAMLFIKSDWNLAENQQSLLVSAAIVGAIIGAAGNGFLADLYGRKKVIIATALIFIIASFMCAFSPDITWLVISRMLIGVAVGMVNFVVPVYLSEIAPQRIRGMLVSLFQLAITAGILFSYLVNGAFAEALYNWRWMMGAGVLPALVLLVGIIFLEDTPRWLLSKQREDEAKAVFKKIEPDQSVTKQIKEIKENLAAEKSSSNNKISFQSWMLMPIFVGVGMMFAQICTGINTIIYYTATIFQNAGFASNTSAIYATIGVGAVNFVMTLVAIFFADRWGRKPLLYAGLWGMLIALICLGTAFRYGDVLGESLRWVAVGSVVVYIACFAFSLGPIGWIMVSEVLPLKIRGFAMGVCTVANFTFNLIVVSSFPILTAKIGEGYTFWIFGVISVLCLLFVFFYVPETKGISLEKIEANWRNRIPARKF